MSAAMVGCQIVWHDVRYDAAIFGSDLWILSVMSWCQF